MEPGAVYARDRDAWREWLQQNHATKDGIWLVYYKRRTGKPSIDYTAAVEEALCFGWIDGQIKKIDDDKYMQRYTRRKPKSIWSQINIERARKLIKEGRMTQWGLEVFHEGMKSTKRIPSSKDFSIPEYFWAALSRNPDALKNFGSFPPSGKLAYVYWVDSAKKEETREKRMKKAIKQLAANKKYGQV